MKRLFLLSLVVLAFAAPAYGGRDRSDEIQAPRSHEIQAPVRPDEVQAPVRPDEVQAPRGG